MENSSSLLGTRRLIKRHELVRIVLQCLYSLGYSKSASTLETESGIRCKSAELELLGSQILKGNWDDCINTLNALDCLAEDSRTSALFLVSKHWLLECLNRGDDTLALSILQERVSKLGITMERVQNLSSSILSIKDIELGVMNDNIVQELRRKLLIELEKLLPPPISLPEGRLEHLIETAVMSQLDRCVYHNSSRVASLYEDHCCGRDQIPTETVQILTEHKNEVWFVQFSHNGEYLASSSSDCTAIIWKVQEDGKVIPMHTLQSHQIPVSFVTWSPDDTKLLTCGNAEVAKLWDVKSGACEHTFGDRDFVVGSCAWFPDSKQLICGSSHSKKGMCMWARDGTEIKAWRGSRMPKILDLAVTSDGENLISVLSERDIRVLNLVTNAERLIVEEHPITSLSLSADSKFFIVNLNNQEIHLWDVKGDMKKPLRYSGHRQRKYVIRSCFGGLNSSFIASGSEDSQVYVWNRQSTRLIEVLSGHKMTVNCVSWNPMRQKMLASASDDHTIRIWAPATKTIP
ncbi:hypothetical protein SAY87_003555 [Trapa incisa]|uniref:CTLH domain-containing protein n=1 Tax=Trapa incisa TaxID=236973 RepID=A0AAN7KJB0_9MYRT|nr:hypothetical protein SAY87_003555 [Trapa incisa]